MQAIAFAIIFVLAAAISSCAPKKDGALPKQSAPDQQGVDDELTSALVDEEDVDDSESPSADDDDSETTPEKPFSEDLINKILAKFDSDANGELSKDELRNMMHKLRGKFKKSSYGWQRHDIRKAKVKECLDVDGDGKISGEERLNFWEKIRECRLKGEEVDETVQN